MNLLTKAKDLDLKSNAQKFTNLSKRSTSN